MMMMETCNESCVINDINSLWCSCKSITQFYTLTDLIMWAGTRTLNGIKDPNTESVTEHLRTRSGTGETNSNFRKNTENTLKSATDKLIRTRTRTRTSRFNFLTRCQPVRVQLQPVSSDGFKTPNSRWTPDSCWSFFKYLKVFKSKKFF